MEDARLGALVFRFSFVAAGVLVVPGTMTDLIDLESARLAEGASSIPAKSSLIGLDTRWSRPFGHSNLAGALVACTLVIGVKFRSWVRLILVIGSAMLFLLTQSQTGILAALIGVLVISITRSTIMTRPVGAKIRWLTIGIDGTLTAMYIALHDPTVDGRTDTWRQFADLSTASPILGAGKNGVNAFVGKWVPESGVVVHHSHAHNLLLDALAPHGLPIALVILLSPLATAWAPTRALGASQPLSLALLASTIVISAIETPGTGPTGNPSDASHHRHHAGRSSGRSTKQGHEPQFDITSQSRVKC